MVANETATPNLQSLRVDLGASSYPIRIGSQWLHHFASHLVDVAPDVSHVLMIHDRSVASTIAQTVHQSLVKSNLRVDSFSVPPGEESKSAAQLVEIWSWMLQCRADRKSVVVAIGGGVTGDLAGFAAASYQRGIRIAQVPTTLLSQVDSSVGGKTGINLPAAKNMIGAFWQPSLVAIDTLSLATLPQREFLSGMAEIVKYGVIESAPFFSWLEEQAPHLMARQPDSLTYAILHSCQSKAAVVGDDERETSGRRAILNYGHTFAHAIEATAGYGTWLHGEAVSIGMQMAAHLANQRGMFATDCKDRQTALLESLGLPTVWSAADSEKMLTAMQSDKKNEHGKIRLILPTRIGHVEMIADATSEEIRQAIHACR